MREHPFELRLCATLEARRDAIVARQIGGGVTQPGNRILDTVLVAPGPAFERRAAITAAEIPPAAIHSTIGPGRARPWPPNDDWHPETAARVLDAAEAVGFFERDRRGGTEYVRQTVRYPDWFGEITAIENKPDLREPGALAAQLRHDVALGLVDRLVVATETHVTGAHLNRLPAPVGVWQFHPDAGEADRVRVVRAPDPLPVEEWGTELLASHQDRVDIRPISPAAKQRARIRLAERAYGKGWRTVDMPACEHARLEEIAGTTVPGCAWFEEPIDPRDCGPDCPGYAAGEPPAVNSEDERDRRTPWVADPSGRATRQAGIEEY